MATDTALHRALEDSRLALEFSRALLRVRIYPFDRCALISPEAPKAHGIGLAAGFLPPGFGRGGG